MEKFSESSGLGISLEVSAGHHYICSVLPEGPVGRSGKLYSGDELLEVQFHSTSGIHQYEKMFLHLLLTLPTCLFIYPRR